MSGKIPERENDHSGLSDSVSVNERGGTIVDQVPWQQGLAAGREWIGEWEGNMAMGRALQGGMETEGILNF